MPSASALQPFGTEVPVNGGVFQPHPVVSLKCPLKDLYLPRCHYEVVSPGPRGLDTRTGPQTPLAGQGTSHAGVHSHTVCAGSMENFRRCRDCPCSQGALQGSWGALGAWSLDLTL